jgi:tRNA A-37 threonylcarbamoyl transferase component Bud32
MTPSTDGFRPVLDALSAGAEDYFGDSAARVEPIGRLDRPFSGLLRLRITTRTEATHAFLKIYKPRPPVPYAPDPDLSRMVEEEYAATLRMYRALTDRPGLAAPRPISVFPEHKAIVTEELTGTSFDRLLRAEAWRLKAPAMLQAIATRIGAWIREYQRVMPAAGDLSLPAQREYIDERLRYITPRILSRDERAATLAFFDELAAEVGPARQSLVAIHADLCPANILITEGGGVGVLDFAMAQSGSRFHDAAHLYMHLNRQRLRPRIGAPFIPSVLAALLRAVDESATRPDPLFRLMLLQHAVCHVTQLAGRSGGPVDGALCWLIRRRWRSCMATPGLQGPISGARPAPMVPAHPSKLPIH